jgi:hypothetical protein
VFDGVPEQLGSVLQGDTLLPFLRKKGDAQICSEVP